MATSYTITKRAEWLHGLSMDEFDLREVDNVDSEFVIQQRNVNPFLIDLERRQRDDLPECHRLDRLLVAPSPGMA
jgi:hypothetical protein